MSSSIRQIDDASSQAAPLLAFGGLPPEPAVVPEADVVTSGRAVAGAGWLGLSAVISKGAQTVVLLVLAGLLAPSEIGVLSIGALVLNVTNTLSNLGTSTALVYWRGDVEKAARSALTLALGSAAALTGLGWVLAPYLASALRAGGLGTEVIRGLVLCLPFSAVADVGQEMLRRKLAFRRLVYPDIVGTLVGAALSVVLALDGYGAMALVFGQLVQYALVMVLRWTVSPLIRPGWHRRDVAGLLSYGTGVAGANAVQLLMLSVDYVLIARVLGTQSLGVYSMAFRLAYMPYLLIAVVLGGAAFAHLCRLDGPAVGRGLTDTMRDTLSLVVPIYLGMFLLAPDIVLLGHAWAAAEPALRWLACYGLLLSLVRVCIVGLNAVSHTRDSFVLNLAHLLLLTVLVLLWVRLGVTMVAAAQVVAGAVVLVLALLIVRHRISGQQWRRLLSHLVPVAIGCLAMTTLWWVSLHLLPAARTSIGGLLVLGPLMLLAYVVPILVLGGDGRAHAETAAHIGTRALR